MLSRITPTRPVWRYAAALILAATPAALSAQWLGGATPGVPHTPDGKANLLAPAPRTADGQPALSRMGRWINLRTPRGAQCTDTQISREFIHIAAPLKDPLPYQ